MKFWLDAQPPSSFADWLAETFSVEAVALRDIGLRDAIVQEIFSAARQIGVPVITKNSDFAELVYRLGAPPEIVWTTCGNASSAHMKQLLGATFQVAILLLKGGATLVEITEK